jgi:hypothetical protein
LDFALYVDYHLAGVRGRPHWAPPKQAIPMVNPTANRAAVGWDAGKDVFLERPGYPLVWISAMAFDTATDGNEAADAMVEALRRSSGTSWQQAAAWPTVSGRDGVRVLDYTTANGRGRLMQRGAEVLALDGAPADRFDALWAVLEATRFEKSPGDGY